MPDNVKSVKIGSVGTLFKINTVKPVIYGYCFEWSHGL